MKRRIVAILLVGAFCAVLTGCNKSAPVLSNTQVKTTTTKQATAATTVATATGKTHKTTAAPKAKTTVTQKPTTKQVTTVTTTTKKTTYRTTAALAEWEKLLYEYNAWTNEFGEVSTLFSQYPDDDAVVEEVLKCLNTSEEWNERLSACYDKIADDEETARRFEEIYADIHYREQYIYYLLYTSLKNEGLIK